MIECAMRRKHGLLSVFVAATLFGATAPYPALPSASVDVAAADNAFGFRLLNAVQKTNPSRNVVLLAGQCGPESIDGAQRR